ncbi:MAG: hypothetical protein IJL26_13485 [Clostridia bacterium]|nr:hypothetical protein [Clostridia bacterium]
MRVLFIVGGELSVNSSANLCHLAYIRGFCAAGHTVDVLSARDDGARIDSGMALPAEIRNHYTYPVSVYEKLSHLKNRARGAATVPGDDVPAARDDGGRSVLAAIKGRIRSIYGVYGTDAAWLSHMKKFRAKTYYDVVLSLSCPFVSHRAAEYLIKSERVDCGRWIQIWEDPWYGDIACDSHNDSCFKEERRLCAAARDIVYVSPVTLMYQQRRFPESAAKMRFVPTPAYYPPEAEDAGDPAPSDVFGYFGDYEPSVRNLAPFYEAARETNVRAFICGSSSAPFRGTERIDVLPRMPLSELHSYERKTGVLVFLCNLNGGQIPGKIFQYSAQNKPILFILDGTGEEKDAIRGYFGGFGRYVFCENETEDIKRAINEIRSGGAPRNAIDAFSPARTVERLIP